MATTRRDILRSGLIAGAGMALPSRLLASGARGSEGGAVRPSATSQPVSPVNGFTRGPGLYPGAPEENFQPKLLLNPAAPFCNLALLRPAFASSAYDYNLTAQLVTDGLIHEGLPEWISVVVDGEVLPKHEREIVVDHFESAVLELPGDQPTVELHLGGGTMLPEISRMEVFIVVPDAVDPAAVLVSVSSSDDGHSWQVLGSAHGGEALPAENFPPDLARGAHLLRPSISFKEPVRARRYRTKLSMVQPAHAGTGAGTANAGTTEAAMASMPVLLSWRLGQLAFFNAQGRVNLGGPYSFTSAWKSAGADREWVSVDLGARFSFSNVKLHWIARAAEGTLQVSDDNTHWRDVQPLTPIGEQAIASVDDLRLANPVSSRYVRVLLERPASDVGYILSEFEVFGNGGFIAQPRTALTPRSDGELRLAGGRWRLQRAGAGDTSLTGEAISAAGYRDDQWLIATVPGTALTSYYNLGALPDPNFSQNQLHISDSFFYADFWYRTEFTAPAAQPERYPQLRLSGVNWKADVFLNGRKLGSVDGAFIRGDFDVREMLRPGEVNALAILVHRNATPGSCKQKTLESTGKNGGALGADNPTYHASIGWDWIPTIRGRNSGLWAEIALVQSGAVTLHDPLVSSVVASDHGYADVTLACNAVNHTAKAFQGVLRARFGAVACEQRVVVPANGSIAIRLSADSHKQLRIRQPELWWPVGYGEPQLYDVTMTIESRQGVLDRKEFKAGIRQITSDESGGNLRLFINGRRLIPKGGSWGFSESMLRFREREYDAAVRYHREMNFNMIRNWVGQVGDDAFFEACDRYGVLVWQDFWLANPWDGPVPDDDAMFLANSRDFLLRIRQHACIGIYCGRNEWYPPKVLDAGLRSQLAELHPGIPYIGSSADGPVSGHGPYHALPAASYFEQADTKLHSEIGAPAIPPIESVRQMMPEEALWPLSLDYGLHDFTLQGAQGGTAFLTLIDQAYGGATDANDWVSLGEIISYESYRAIFEAQSVYRMGTLLWMSHPCWPSFVWQTYDFFFQPTASYFGSKLGTEPLHIQWNPARETIEVVNYSAGSVGELTARVEVLNLDGRVVSTQAVQVNCPEDSTATALKMTYPANVSAVHFLRLTLLSKDVVRSSNFYLRGREQGDLRAIRTLPKVALFTHMTREKMGDRWMLRTQLQNNSSVPALYVRVQAERARTGDRITPAIYDANYFALMPGETRVVTTELQHRDTRGEEPRIRAAGFNVLPADHPGD